MFFYNSSNVQAYKEETKDRKRNTFNTFNNLCNILLAESEKGGGDRTKSQTVNQFKVLYVLNLNSD
jgi:hypothetical protein